MIPFDTSLSVIEVPIQSFPSAPDDYEAVNRTLTFDSATTRLVIPVRIINDAIDEEDEELISRLQLEPVEEGSLPNVQVDPDQTTLIIEDDDSKLNTVES